jgi:glycerol-3-phosphate dehydrogenase subunit B
MENLIGVSLFEIPTIPPAVAGIRLREMFERELPVRGLSLEPQLKVHDAKMHQNGATLYLRGAMEDIEVEAEAVVLTTGRFLSGGLSSDSSHLSETLFDLPLSQPKGRENWYRRDYLDPRGHAINRAGIETDDLFRPIDQGKNPASERLFAAGSILAHQDWVRQRCGVGLAIATAYGAVQSAAEALN